MAQTPVAAVTRATAGGSMDATIVRLSRVRKWSVRNWIVIGEFDWIAEEQGKSKVKS